VKFDRRDGGMSSEITTPILLIENYEYPLAEEGIQVALIQIARTGQTVLMLLASHTTPAYREH
jgi:hypothetical protein